MYIHIPKGYFTFSKKIFHPSKTDFTHAQRGFHCKSLSFCHRLLQSLCKLICAGCILKSAGVALKDLCNLSCTLSFNKLRNCLKVSVASASEYNVVNDSVLKLKAYF